MEKLDIINPLKELIKKAYRKWKKAHPNSALDIINTPKKLKKAYRKWKKAHPNSAKETKVILKEIGNLLDKEISADEFFFEEFTTSPSNTRKTPQIVIYANSRVLSLLDEFLQKSSIIACREDFCLRIDC